MCAKNSEVERSIDEVKKFNHDILESRAQEKKAIESLDNMALA